MMISKNVGFQLPVEPGKITCGRKTADGKMEKLKFFDVSDFPVIQEYYGQEPNKLLVAPPVDDINLILKYRDIKWGSAGERRIKVRECDGERCIHYVAETIGKESYGAREESECVCLQLGLKTTEDKELKKRACRFNFDMFVWVLHPESSLKLTIFPIHFHTSSRYSCRDVLSVMQAVQWHTFDAFGVAKLQRIPFWLSVQWVEEPPRSYPLWNLDLALDSTQLNAHLLETAQRLNIPLQIVSGLTKDLKDLPGISARRSEFDQRAVEEPELVDDGTAEPDNPIAAKSAAHLKAYLTALEKGSKPSMVQKAAQDLADVGELTQTDLDVLLGEIKKR